MPSGAGELKQHLTEELLRSRLRILAPVFFVTAVLLVTIDILSGRAFAPIIQILLMLVLGSITGLLLAERSISLKPLRALELTVFGSVAVYLAVGDYNLIYQSAMIGDGGLILSGLIKSVLHFVVLVAAYGILIPNTRGRTALVVIPLALTPLAVMLLLQGRHPQLAETVIQAASGQMADAGVLLMVSAVVAIAGTQIVSNYRDQEVEAVQMGLYTLSERIGSGGMGEVWLAAHQKLVRPAVIKLIRPEMLETADSKAALTIMRRFEKEAQATAGLRSPHTVELYDLGVTDNGVFYYVMEHLNGIDLTTLVEKHGAVSPERTVHLLRQVCDSLAEAHNNHLIHRDIKPSNIFVCRMGLSYDFVKVLDFGLVKTQANEDGDTQLTMEGTTTGTPAFMAPESVSQGDQVDGRADIYALGCVGYWLLTGGLVFQQNTPVAMIADHLKESPVAPSRRTENEIPEALDQIILKCLEKDPAKRFQTATDLSDALSNQVKLPAWDNARAADWWKLHHPQS